LLALPFQNVVVAHQRTLQRETERERETERGGRESMAEKQTRSDLKKNMQAQASSRHENGDEA